MKQASFAFGEGGGGKIMTCHSLVAYSGPKYSSFGNSIVSVCRSAVEPSYQNLFGPSSMKTEWTWWN